MNTPAQVVTPFVDLLRHPDGSRDRQVLFGETVQVKEVKSGWSHIEADKDGYCGHIPSQFLGPLTPASHWVSAPSTHVYAKADLKSPDRMALSFGSQITVTSQGNNYAETSIGYIPSIHLTPIGTHLNDPLEVAQLFMGTPYLWGGNTRFGIDCSGLVQAAYIACGWDCPGDSSQQIEAFGTGLPNDTTPQRHDLLFFQGHVAMVFDQDTLLHANAFHMAVSFEPLRSALRRINAQGDGKVIRHVRPVPR